MSTARQLYILIIACIVSLTSAGQCLTDFSKLVPERSTDYTTNFGSSISVYNDLLAIGSPGNDSLGSVTGIAYIYQRMVDNTWKKIVTIAPSDPQATLGFGVSVKLTANYLAVGASGFGGSVYVFKKPPGGWINAVENYKLTIAGSIGLASSPIDPIDISDDERTIAIVDQFKHISSIPSRSGIVYVFHRQANDEWKDHTPFNMQGPAGYVVDFGRAGVHIIGDRIVTGTPLSPHPYGTIYIYRDPSGEFNNPILEARLTVNPNQGTTGVFSLGSLAVFDDGIVSAAPTYLNVPGGGGLAFFKKPVGNVWADAEPTCVYRTNLTRVDMLTTDGTDIFARFNSGGGSRFGVIKKGSSEWCNATVEIIKNIPGSVGDVLGPYASRITASGGNVVTGMAALPDNPDASLALEAFHENGSSWSSALVADPRKTTSGHTFGQAVLTHGNHLFVGAPRDGTIRANAGAVYIYKKQGASWIKTSKILPPVSMQYDNAFGSALAINHNQLAVGALGFEPRGKIFIYNKNGSDWTNPTLAQTIEIPADLVADFYGDNLAMNDELLVVPYTVSNPFRIKIAIYVRAVTTWVHIQSVDIQDGNIFAKQMTVGVDIDGETIVAGGTVVERNADGVWRRTALLTPSDPEVIQFTSNFSLLTNGSSFGYSVDIEGDNIFIGAPQKDLGSAWDVGAVYVYAKQPGREWSNMKERVKILPRVKDESDLFGFSLDALGNTLIVGAPGADRKKDGTDRNKAGRSYIFQATDYFWEHVTPLQDFTGDTFTKDYYGVSVGLDGDNFIIGASIEDLPSGRLSGSVYVAPSPSIVKLVPPTCVTYEEVDLVGYPFGGTWSGPALIDGAEGKFSPAVAGIGVHEFEYTTASCIYTGKLQIEVVGPVSLSPITPEEIIVCNEPASISIPLAVTDDGGANYQWFYRAADATEFVEIDEHAATMAANNRGEYYVEVFNAGCSINSPIMRIHNEDVEVKIDPPIGCIQPSTQITLTAEPPGGVWSGVGMNGAKFSPGVAGAYPVTYTYTSAKDCFYSESISIEVAPVFIPAITRVTGSLCDAGTVALSVGNALSGATFDWHYKSNSSGSLESLNTAQRDITVIENGSYIVKAEYKGCQSESPAFVLNDQLKVNLVSNTDKIDVCFGSETTLATTAPAGAVVTWNFASVVDDTPEIIDTAPTHNATKGGYYFAEVSKGTCTAVTNPVHVVILAQDTLRAPNVFTPNGDGKNDSFSVSIGSENREMTIFNRFGSPVFQNKAGGSWDGGNHPTGVYFWVAIVPGCEEDRTVNGFVQLVR